MYGAISDFLLGERHAMTKVVVLTLLNNVINLHILFGREVNIHDGNGGDEETAVGVRRTRTE